MIKFSDLALDPRVLKAVQDAGYETPTPIQAQAIPHALAGRDVLGIAQTGTGKTASFVLPMITLLGKGRARARMPRSLVLAPTRELAAQVAENFETYAKHSKLTKALLIGGVSFGEQDKLIDRGVDVLIATPGRLLDHFERGKLLLTGVQIMVVDEADRMLDIGFIPDIERIFSLTPFTRQTFFYSATMAPEIERITNTFLSNAVKIEVARQATSAETIAQQLVRFTPSRKDRTASEKREVLRALIRAEGESCTNAIIFCNRKVDVDIVAKSLKQNGFNASPIHGDLEQSLRTRTLDGFRDGTIHLLVASDVAARGLDIPAVSHIFNFDVPSHAEDYVHRIGRTGRAGRLGKAITIATPNDEKYLAAIEHLVKQPIPEGALPEGFAPSGAGEKPVSSRPGDRDDGRDSGSDSGRDSKPGRSRSRSRDRSSPRQQEEQRPPQETPAEAVVVAEVATPPQSRPAPAATPAPARRDESRDERKDDRGRDRRDNRRDHGDRVVGMGDHVPDFILRTFRATSPAADADEPENNADSADG
ncbi:MAG: DEAD/DEAH box helicase [Pseudorhodobacter sp.]|nr:DEAD/DEAH box helicase [Pseudorhodobacter sp.]